MHIDRETLLASYPIFSLLPRQEISKLANKFYEIFIPPGFTIVHENDIVDSIYLIADGEAEVTRHSTLLYTTNDVIIAKLGKGEAIGITEAGFFSKTGIRTAKVVSLSKMHLLGIGVNVFNHYLSEVIKLYPGLSAASNLILKMNIIKYAAPFMNISSDNVLRIAKQMKEKHYSADSIIFRQGDVAHSCFLLKHGEVEIRRTRTEHDSKLIATLHKNELFGETALLTLSVRNAMSCIKG